MYIPHYKLPVSKLSNQFIRSLSVLSDKSIIATRITSALMYLCIEVKLEKNPAHFCMLNLVFLMSCNKASIHRYHQTWTGSARPCSIVQHSGHDLFVLQPLGRPLTQLWGGSSLSPIQCWWTSEGVAACSSQSRLFVSSNEGGPSTSCCSRRPFCLLLWTDVRWLW